jgi:fimbrial chaperone protein
MPDKFHTLLAAAALTLAATAAQAASLQVAPTTVDLPAKGGTATLYVSNNGAGPIGVHVEAFAWSQPNGHDELQMSRAIQVSPPMTRLKPGERQTIRLRVAAQKSTGERTFRLVASELPDPSDRPRNGVRVLFQFSVPVFVGEPAKNVSAQLSGHLSHTSAGDVLALRNTGSIYAKLSGVKLVPPAGAPIDVAHGSLVYVLAGASPRWNLGTVSVTPGKTFHVEAHDDRSRRAISIPVSAVP